MTQWRPIEVCDVRTTRTIVNRMLARLEPLPCAPFTHCVQHDREYSKLFEQKPQKNKMVFKYDSTQTPFINWDGERNGWRVFVPSNRAKRANYPKHFTVRKYGSIESALAFATEHRDELLTKEELDRVYRHMDRIAQKITMPRLAYSDARYKPRIHSQWQLWHKKQTP